jgi:hypothetical protein
MLNPMGLVRAVLGSLIEWTFPKPRPLPDPDGRQGLQRIPPAA